MENRGSGPPYLTSIPVPCPMDERGRKRESRKRRKGGDYLVSSIFHRWGQEAVTAWLIINSFPFYPFTPPSPSLNALYILVESIDLLCSGINTNIVLGLLIRPPHQSQLLYTTVEAQYSGIAALLLDLTPSMLSPSAFAFVWWHQSRVRKVMISEKCLSGGSPSPGTLYWPIWVISQRSEGERERKEKGGCHIWQEREGSCPGSFTFFLRDPFPD